MINKRLINTGEAIVPFDPLQNFETVTYTGNGGTQKITGYIRKGAAFNGSSRITSNDPVKNDTTFSISAWINVDNINTFNPIISVYGSTAGARKYLFRVSDSNSLDFFTYDESGVITGIVQKSSALTVGTWHHVVATVESGGDLELYLDGVSVATDTGNSNVNTDATADLIIGSRDDYAAGSSVNNFNGKIDQVRIFNRALDETTDGEVTTLYNETYASSTKSTTDIFGDSSGVALYELDEDANDTGTTPYGTGAIDSGQSAVFNGSSSYIDTNFTVPASSTFSISWWQNLSYVGSNEYIFSDADSVGSDQSFAVYHTGTTFGVVGTGISSNLVSTTTIGSWAHFAVVLNGTTLKIYKNGSEIQSRSITARAAAANRSLIIGRLGDYSGQTVFNITGSIDQVRIYSSALSASDVVALVSETNVPTANLVAHYKLDGNANDETGSYNGTPTSITYSDPAEFPLIAYNGTPTNVNFLGMAFQPDFVWVKNRTGSADHHSFIDSVRGTDSQIFSNLTNAENTFTDQLTSFDSNGFTIQGFTGAEQGRLVNVSSTDYVAWCWKAGGAAVSNTNGSITSTVSANPDAGFSIVKYTGNSTAGATVGHGLSSVPQMIIVKRLSLPIDNWAVYNETIGNTKRLALDASAAATPSGRLEWNSTTPTSTVFTLGNHSAVNQTSDYIAYCFHSVDGYQRISSYPGTGVNGNRIYTTDDGTSSGSGGFEPRWLLVKRTDVADNWVIVDNVRGLNNSLFPDDPSNELNNSGAVSFNSDGFTVNGASGGWNNGSGTYIYLAIA